MGLKLLKNPDGSYRRQWYATISRQGQHVSENLGIAVRGKIPLDESGRYSLTLKGDEAFEKSKTAALAQLDKIIATSKEDPDIIESKAYRKRTGKKLVETPLATLPAKWRGLARATTPTESRMKVYDSYFSRFATFAKSYSATTGTEIKNVNDLTSELAAEFFNSIREEYAWETVKGIMSLLSGAFQRFATNGRPNPFKNIIKRRTDDGTRINKKPISEAEIAKVLDIVRQDEDKFAYPLYALVLTAASTGMRLGDVCHLKWSAIDLQGGFIDCVTAKAGVRVTIPIFDKLRLELETLATATSAPDINGYVFPSAAAEYERNRSGITRAIKPYLARAVFGDAEQPEVVQLPTEKKPRKKTPVEILAAIDNARWSPEKKKRIRDTYYRFSTGSTYDQITAATGRAKGWISEDLRYVEELTGETIRKGSPTCKRKPKKNSKHALEQLTRTSRSVGMFAASLYGWHSFRTSFVVMAIENGVPIEDVRKIVGHKTEKMTMDYYRPTKKHAAERVRRQMRKSVLNNAPTGETIDIEPKPELECRSNSQDMPTLPPPAPAAETLNIADAIRRILETPGLSPEAKNTAIAALTAAKVV